MAVLEIFGTDNSVIVPTWATESLTSFRDWYASDDFPEEGRICYLAGEVYVEMGHERLSSHVNLKTALARVLDALAEKLSLGQYFGDGVRLVNEEADFSSEPDGCYVTWSSVKDGRVSLRESNDGDDVTELVGTPEMVLEIISPSSVKKDKATLRGLYHDASIPEYWLIDARKDQLRFEILRSTRKGYSATPDQDGWLPSRVFNRKFRLKRTKNPIGLWQYKVLVRPIA